MKRLLLVASLFAPAAHAATFTVTRLDDPAPNGCLVGDCSLREAVLAAEATSVADSIVLGAGQHVLRGATSSTPVTINVTRDLAFVGAGRDATRIASEGLGSMFALGKAAVSFSSLTLQDGYAAKTSVGGVLGGAVRATGSVVAFDAARLVNHRAQYGGAVHLVDSTLDLSNTVVESNRSKLDGAGIHATRTPIRLRAGSVVATNVADVNGGGIWTDDEVVGDDDCAIRDNRANRGGGISSGFDLLNVQGVATAGGDGLFEISGNAVSGIEPMYNVPNGTGGGILARKGAVISRVALLDNTSDNIGGGVSSSIGTFILRDSYLAGNQAAHGGGGAFAQTRESTFMIERVGFDGNAAGNYGSALSLSSATWAEDSAARATLRNVDFHGNLIDGEGGTLYNSAHATLSHVTFWDNVNALGASAVWQYEGGSLVHRNSVMLGRCVGDVTGISAVGNNLRSNEATNACGGTVATPAMSLSRGTFGGRFAITGTTDAASTIIDAGHAMYCLSTDIRGRTRPAACDLGAFEHGVN